ncbi:MAG: hypothetical protein C5B47_02915 [Verrucomicrobia bacterium]|nr:MAG: hypothetical protein C5B47_02915 [Verrucomicrobiota bacterium]
MEDPAYSLCAPTGARPSSFVSSSPVPKSLKHTRFTIGIIVFSAFAMLSGAAAVICLILQ